jgi:predicted ATPase
MAALDWITVEGFKSIKRIDRLPLEPINIVIGANGSGKSNLIGVFSFLREIRSGRLQEYVIRSGGADRILHFGSRMTPELRMQVSFGGEVGRYEIELGTAVPDALIPLSETCVGPGAEQPATVGSVGGYHEAWISQRDLHNIDGEIVHNVRSHLDGWRAYHFHDTSPTSPIRKTADVDDNRFLRHDGANLAAFLYFLSHKHEEAYDLIRRTVRLVAPFFDDFRLQPRALNEDKIRLEWRHLGSDAYFDASSLSDGTLRFIVLATLLLQPGSLRPSVILLDEPELGLHPFAITMLASLVKQASVDTQVVFATQSTLLLDHFRPEDVLVADRVDGGTQLTRLHGAALEEWLQDYSLGQLWEKNHFGGRPGRSGAERQ